MAAIVAQLPEAAQRLRRTMQRDGSPGPIDQVKKAAEELQKTADQAAGGQNAVPDNVRRVQIEEPAINVKQYDTWGSTSLIAFAGQATLVFFSSFSFSRRAISSSGNS